MDWNSEVKILSRALKESKNEKNKLEANMGDYIGDKSHQYQCLMARRQLIIQNIQARLETARKELEKEAKSNIGKKV